MFTITPRRRSIIGPSACFAMRNGPSRLVVSTSANSDVAISCTGSVGPRAAALLTTAVTGPRRSARWTVRITSSSLLTSAGTATTSVRFSSSDPARSSASGSRPVMHSFEPRFANSRAIENPMPRLAPVTIATEPFMRSATPRRRRGRPCRAKPLLPRRSGRAPQASRSSACCRARPACARRPTPTRSSGRRR